MSDIPTTPDRLLLPEEVCQILNVKNVTLQDWRLIPGKGPAFVRLGHRTVRYRQSAVDAYLESLDAPVELTPGD